MKKYFTLIAVAAMAFAAQATEWTAADGTTTSEYAPVYGYNFETDQHNQMQYPASELTGIAAGTEITAMKFYTSTPSLVNALGGTVTVSLANMEDVTPWTPNAWGGVYGDLLDVAVTAVATVTPSADENGVWTITFDAPFTYAGNALLVDIKSVAGDYQDTEFYVKEMGSYLVMSTYGYAGSTKGDNKLPKATFVYGSDEPIEITSYTVVGPESIFGSNWNTEDTNNDMVLDEATGVYSWNKTGVTLYGNFDFKVVGNHSYSIYEWPVGPYNWTAVVEEEGIYSIAITFDPNAEEDYRITCTLIKTGDIDPVEHTYTVAGTTNLFGSFWDTSDTANDMVKGEDGIYTWTKNDVVFEEAANVEFKVVQDHAWDYAWPSSNWIYEVTEAGTYDFVITFNAETKEITCTATKHDAPQGMRGDVNMSNDVTISDVTSLIDYLLSGDETGISVVNANCNLDEGVTIADVTALIDYLLSGVWAE